jgi:cytidylate kinase
MQATHSFADGRGKYPDHIGFKAPRDLRVRAQQLAEREGVSLAEILRRALERGMAEPAGQVRPC